MSGESVTQTYDRRQGGGMSPSPIIETFRSFLPGEIQSSGTTRLEIEGEKTSMKIVMEDENAVAIVLK